MWKYFHTTLLRKKVLFDEIKNQNIIVKMIWKDTSKSTLSDWSKMNPCFWRVRGASGVVYTKHNFDKFECLTMCNKNATQRCATNREEISCKR